MNSIGCDAADGESGYSSGGVDPGGNGGSGDGGEAGEGDARKGGSEGGGVGSPKGGGVGLGISSRGIGEESGDERVGPGEGTGEA
jgi:hypothetical protein